MGPVRKGAGAPAAKRAIFGGPRTMSSPTPSQAAAPGATKDSRGRGLGWGLVVGLLVLLGWVPFRAVTLEDTGFVLGQMFAGGAGGPPPGVGIGVMLGVSQKTIRMPR